MKELISDYKQESEICKVLSKYSIFKFEELFFTWNRYKSFDLLIKAISYSRTYSVSLDQACYILNKEE